MMKVKLIAAVFGLALVIWFGAKLGALVDDAGAGKIQAGGLVRIAAQK